MKKSLAALVLVVALAGCSDDRPHSGIVTDKQVTQQSYMQCVVYTKGFCSSYVPVYYDVYRITIQNEGGKTGTWDLTHEEYDAVRVGDQWSA